MSDADELELWYFADPMCSWCWGFSPVINALADEWGDRLGVRVFAGGLAPGTRGALTGDLKAEVRQHWEHVHEASGQPFDWSFFDREGFVYDTEPCCRALVTAREMNEDLALPMLAALHEAFYAKARDLTDDGVLIDVAVSVGFDRNAFTQVLSSEALAQATLEDFAASRQLGIRGYPTLVGRQPERLIALTMGYQPLDAMREIVSEWATQAEAGVAASASN